MHTYYPEMTFANHCSLVISHAWTNLQTGLQNSGFSFFFLSLAALTFLFIFKIFSGQEAALRRPPGPKPHWLIGNKIPNDRQWLKFDEWSKEYGEFLRIASIWVPVQ
jgi:hypothetical protein